MDALKTETYTFDPSDYEDYICSCPELLKDDMTADEYAEAMESDRKILERVITLLTVAGHVSKEKLDLSFSLAESLP